MSGMGKILLAQSLYPLDKEILFTIKPCNAAVNELTFRKDRYGKHIIISLFSKKLYLSLQNTRYWSLYDYEYKDYYFDSEEESWGNN
ncbi:MAG TPA: hypothetical protein VMX17_04710 [Candidatus Glassbacteria bacterium]|nr:hypothetical protein [Candidatus Glassbacteria bacterium]